MTGKERIRVMHDRKRCVWCGSAVEPEAVTKAPEPPMCPECSETYDLEHARSLHPTGARQPYHD